MASQTDVRVEIKGSRATLTFVTEGGLNVASREVLVRLANGVESIAHHPEVRVTVVRAEGKVFVAGADIKELSTLNPAQAKDFSIFGNRVMDGLERLPCVTVAALQGAALGGGCEIALACDFRFAVESAKIGLPETSLGVIPGWGGTQRIVKWVGPSHGRRLVFSANPISAAEAKAIGLVDQVVADGAALETAVNEFAKSLVRGGPRAVGLAKRAFLTGDEPSAFAACFEPSESKEGIEAFLNKKAAPWMESNS